jgi:hypothetical protein
MTSRVYPRATLGVALLVAFTAAAAAQTKPAPFSCAIQPDGVSVRVVITNPHAHEAHCTAHCEFSTTKADTSFIVECGTSISANAGGRELCIKKFESGRVLKLLEGKGECLNSAVKADDDDDADSEALVQRLQQQGKEFLDRMKKQP